MLVIQLRAARIKPGTNEARANHGTGSEGMQDRRVKHQLRQCDRRDARARAKKALSHALEI